MPGLIDTTTGLADGTSGLIWLAGGLGGDGLDAQPPPWVLISGGTPATLDIYFTKNIAWNSPYPVTVASLLTCTRATPPAAYYTNADLTLSSFAANTLRYGTNGLLVEESRVNLVLQSQTFDNATWGKNEATVTANSIAAPDGTTTADTVTPSIVDTTHHRVSQTVAVSDATVYQETMYAKANGYTKLAFVERISTGAYSSFNLSGAGSVLDNGNGGAGSITALANGWYRCTMASTSSGTSFGSYIYVLSPSYTTGDPTSSSWIGDGVSGVYLWGDQLEAGAFATSYIPTTTVAVTRAADNISFGTLTWVNATTGTFYGSANSLTTATYLLSGVSGVAIPRSGTASQAIADNGTNTITATAGLSTWASTSKAALAYDGTGRSLCMNAGTVATDANLIGTLSSIYVGSNAGAAGLWDGYITRVTYWNSKRTDAQLQTLTT